MLLKNSGSQAVFCSLSLDPGEDIVPETRDRPKSWKDGTKVMTKLYIMSGQDKGLSFDLQNGINYLGRSPDCDIPVNDESISREHLKIVKEGNRYFIEDLKSANGTYVDGKEIKPGVALEVKEGLPISVGTSVICLGTDYPEDMLSVLDSIDFSKDLAEDSSLTIQDRPMTFKRNTELFSKVSNILMQSLNLNEILEKILDYIFDLLSRIDRGVIILADKKTGKISEVITSSRDRSDDAGTMYCRTIVDRVLREGKSVMISDTHTEEDVDLSESLKLMRIRSVMCVPLISNSQLHGVLYIASSFKPHGFRQDDLSLITALSTPAALAIENARLYSDRKK